MVIGHGKKYVVGDLNVSHSNGGMKVWQENIQEEMGSEEILLKNRDGSCRRYQL